MDEVNVGLEGQVASRVSLVPGKAPDIATANNRNIGSGMSRGRTPKAPPNKVLRNLPV
jgi:hypothetical protein